jgi:hypothetical protein
MTNSEAAHEEIYGESGQFEKCCDMSKSSGEETANLPRKEE